MLNDATCSIDRLATAGAVGGDRRVHVSPPQYRPGSAAIGDDPLGASRFARETPR